MTPLTQEFVDACPKEGVFRMRGLEMLTRLLHLRSPCW
jgi:hypothetical protein